MTATPHIPIRHAEVSDAQPITELYDEAYRPPSGGGARDHYPFPQLLDPGWVAAALRRGHICWVVAADRGHIVGSAAALRNIGGSDDRVAEVFGIVVRSAAQGRGVGSRLLAALESGLTADADNAPAFVLCEARTAVAAGWKVARNGGFWPLGFEPFAHTTPAGSEAMLLTGKLLGASASLRNPAPLPPLAHALARAALAGTRLPLPPSRAATGEPGRSWACQVARDDALGERFLAGRSEVRIHASGVVGLRRLEGEDPAGHRYDRRYYVARARGAEVGAVRVVWDRVDRRARVLDLQAEDADASAGLLAYLTVDLREESREEQLVVVADIRADTPAVQEALEALGYVPTVYYPALITDGTRRRDAVQYTRIFNRPWQESMRHTGGLDWPAAQDVVSQVRELLGRAAAGRVHGAGA